VYDAKMKEPITVALTQKIMFITFCQLKILRSTYKIKKEKRKRRIKDFRILIALGVKSTLHPSS
jgi:hypothetical protein